MSTREKRLKTDSPTPVLITAESTPSTPTSKVNTAIKLKRLSRNQTSVFGNKASDVLDEESIIEDSGKMNSNQEPITPKTPNTRPKRQINKDTKDEESNNGDVKENAEDSEKFAKDAKSAEVETPSKKKRVLPKTDVKATEKKVEELSLVQRRAALLKRKSMPIPTKPLRTLGRRLSSGYDLKKLAKDSKLVTPIKAINNLRNGKPRIGNPLKKKREKLDKEEERIEVEIETTEDVMEEEEGSLENVDAESDKEMDKTEDVASSAASECSEKTIVAESKKIKREPDSATESEKMDVDETKDLQPEKKVAKVSTPTPPSLQGVRRSTRQRKSTQKDRDSPLAARNKSSPEVKVEAADSDKTESISPNIKETKEDKTPSKQIHVDVENPHVLLIIEKDASLSPALISEELDTMSVQKLYDKPHFMENNLGIEQDPKLGEIMKVQEMEKSKNVDLEDKIEREEVTKSKVCSKVSSTEGEQISSVDEFEATEISINVELPAKDLNMVTELLGDGETVVQLVADGLKPKVDEKENKSINVDKKGLKEPNATNNQHIVKLEAITTRSKDNSEPIAPESALIIPKQKDYEKEKVPTTLSASPTVSKTKEVKPKKCPLPIMIIKQEKIDVEDTEVKDNESGEENKENNMDSASNNTPEENGLLKLEVIDSELLRQKESHLMSLGLLTHKAADEAKIAKQKRKDELAKNFDSSSSSSSSYGVRTSKSKNHSSESTGTLKTVIKLHRPRDEKRKTRVPLKMTFQKSKLGNNRDPNGSSPSVENAYYTIHNDKDPMLAESHGGISRKTHNRSHNHDGPDPKLTEEELALVIPEKASSFKVHPDRLCQDQCFYCGGKFGLYDTPCHIAQIKSVERQNKILASEEKLTRDNCLCDACFRHVDRRANCPSYKKRSSTTSSMQGIDGHDSRSYYSSQGDYQHHDGAPCNVTNCHESASHTLRKKWLIKVKKSILKVFHINLDPGNTNNGTVSICDKHYEAISHLMICAMCKRRLPRNHIFYITQDVPRLEHLISEQGMHIKLANSTLVVCKLCRYYANLLIKPPETKTQKAEFVKSYTKKLLQHNNLDVSEYEKRAALNEQMENDIEEVQIRSTGPHEQLTLTIKNGKIQPKKYSNNGGEVTIMAMKNNNYTRSPAPSGHMLLDNDVMVGYDVPMLDPPSPPASYIQNPRYKPPGLSSAQNIQQKVVAGSKQQQLERQKRRELQETNEMARVLKSNPNISMRELFPGEEEMGLQINIPFNSNGSTRTPEGWVKVNTTLQYDDVTRNLWEELQRPYGNQSSFIRHLVLLEKYYRNGDLVLSQSASSSASTYSESVRNRLRAYDNIEPHGASSNSSFSNEITIIPASKMGRKNDSLTITAQLNGQVNSLLKRKSSQQLELSPKPKDKTMRMDDPATPKKLPPPELISFSTKQPITPQLLKQQANIQKSVSSPPQQQPTFNFSNSITITPTTSTSASPISSASTNGPTPNIQILSDTLTPSERKEIANTAWRPTLIPITAGPNSASAVSSNGPLYQTADGRKLPGLVQVMSGGKPYHISIQDYNRMCILRREKLQQQLQQKRQQQGDGSPINGSKGETSTLSKGSPQNTSAPTKNKLVNIPNQILEQNSLIPISGGQTRKSGGSTSLLKNMAPPPKLPNSTSVVALPPSTTYLPSALFSLAKTVNALPSTSLQSTPAWPNMWNENDLNTNDTSSQSYSNINVGGSMVDNSTGLLCKIPKSLTVIPQQKGFDNRRKSMDDRNKNSA